MASQLHGQLPQITIVNVGCVERNQNDIACLASFKRHCGSSCKVLALVASLSLFLALSAFPFFSIESYGIYNNPWGILHIRADVHC